MPNLHRRIRDTSRVDNTCAFAIGVLAAFTLSLLSHVAIALDWPISTPEEIWTSVLRIANPDNAQLVSLSLHLLSGGLLALTYAFLFRSAHRSGFMIGLNLAVIQWFVFGTLATFTRFGPFLITEGAVSATVFLAANMVFGTTIGVLYDIASMRAEFPRVMSRRFRTRRVNTNYREANV